MPTPGEYKTVQARILAYAQEIGWAFVPRAEAERRRGFDLDGATPEARARKASLFFGDLLHARVRAFNPKYKDAEGALVGEFQRFHADIFGNRDFLTALRNQHKFFSAEESRELDLTLIDYGDLGRRPKDWRNVYEVTEEFYFAGRRTFSEDSPRRRGVRRGKTVSRHEILQFLRPRRLGDEVFSNPRVALR